MKEKYRIEGDYLVTDDPVIQATAAPSHALTNSATGIVTAYIAKPQVREALKAEAGKAYFEIPTYKMGDETPLYKLDYFPGTRLAVAVNALTIGGNCGAIRKLIEWSKP